MIRSFYASISEHNYTWISMFERMEYCLYSWNHIGIPMRMTWEMFTFLFSSRYHFEKIVQIFDPNNRFDGKRSVPVNTRNVQQVDFSFDKSVTISQIYKKKNKFKKITLEMVPVTVVQDSTVLMKRTCTEIIR